MEEEVATMTAHDADTTTADRPPPPSPSPDFMIAAHSIEGADGMLLADAPSLMGLTWSEVSAPSAKRPYTAQSRPPAPPPNVKLERPQTAQSTPRQGRGALSVRPTLAYNAPATAPTAPEAPVPRYMQTTRASGTRHASTAADSAWLCDVFGLPVPSPRPSALTAAHRPGNHRRAWRFVEESPRDHPPATQPAVLRVSDGNGPVGRRGPGDASARREWLLQQPMRRRRVLVNQYGGALSASLAYAAPQSPANWLPPISSA